MIKWLKIRNFQGHRSLKVSFNKVTCIVGASDAGKSSIIRAFRWLAFNTPRGNKFITNGQTRTEVQVKVDGSVLSRTKDKTKNEYILDDVVFAAFGTTVPDLIKDKLDLDEANFQQQHDSPFWFGLSSGQVARELNRVVDLDEIHLALKSIAAKVQKNKTEMNYVATSMAALDNTIGSTEPMRHLYKVAKELKSQEQEVLDQARRRIALNLAVKEVKEHQNTISNCTRDHAATTNCVELGTGLVELENNYRRLSKLVSNTTAAQTRQPLFLLNAIRSKQKERIALLTITIERVAQLLNDVKSKQNQLNKIESKLELNKSKCPLCKQKIKS